MKRLALILALVACESAQAADAGHLGGGRKLSASLNDAGISVDESGAPAMLLVTPVTNPFTGQPVTGCNMQGFYGDFNTCIVSSTIVCGEHRDSTPSMQLTPGQCAAIFNGLKASAQSKIDAGAFQ